MRKILRYNKKVMQGIPERYYTRKATLSLKLLAFEANYSNSLRAFIDDMKIRVSNKDQFHS